MEGYYRTFWSDGEVLHLHLDAGGREQTYVKIYLASQLVHQTLFIYFIHQGKSKTTKRRRICYEGEKVLVSKMNLFTSFYQSAMQKQQPLCQALPSLSPVVPLLVCLSSAEMQLGENNVCGPDATSEVTRKNSGRTGRPAGREKRKQTQVELHQPNISTSTDVSFSWRPGKLSWS